MTVVQSREFLWVFMSERHRCNAQSQGAQRFLCRAPTHTTILHLCRLYRWGVIEA